MDVSTFPLNFFSEGPPFDEGGATLADGVLRRVLRAPDTAGTARIVVRLDGVTLRVRPRIRFEAVSGIES